MAGEFCSVNESEFGPRQPLSRIKGARVKTNFMNLLNMIEMFKIRHQK
jgi:hypothetical protein